MNRYLLNLFLLCTLVFALAGCGKENAVLDDDDEASAATPLPTDPPYQGSIRFPSGLKLDLVRDGSITSGYPNPSTNPFGVSKARHYERVDYFIDLPRAPVWENITPNFRLSEYTVHSQRRGGTRAYVDAQIAFHLQEIRSGLGRALIINSAYRTPEHNDSVGGASFSRHIYGDAVDIDIDQTRADANRLAQELFNEALDVGVNFVLPLEETSVSVGGEQRVSWVHLDDRGF